MDSNLIRIILITMAIIFIIAWSLIGRRFNLGLAVVILGGLLGLGAILAVVVSY